MLVKMQKSIEVKMVRYKIRPPVCGVLHLKTKSTPACAKRNPSVTLHANIFFSMEQE